MPSGLIGGFGHHPRGFGPHRFGRLGLMTAPVFQHRGKFSTSGSTECLLSVLLRRSSPTHDTIRLLVHRRFMIGPLADSPNAVLLARQRP